MAEMGFKVSTPSIPFVDIVKMEIALMSDPKEDEYMPYVFVNSIDSDVKKKIYSVTWEDNNDFDEERTILLPIDEKFQASLIIVGKKLNVTKETQYFSMECEQPTTITSSWTCKDGTTIPATEVCNLEETCPDGGDEADGVCLGTDTDIVKDNNYLFSSTVSWYYGSSLFLANPIILIHIFH